VAPTAPPLSGIDEQPSGLDAYQQPAQNAPRTARSTYTTEETVIAICVHNHEPR